jgi:hypothetical protein
VFSRRQLVVAEPNHHSPSLAQGDGAPPPSSSSPKHVYYGRAAWDTNPNNIFDSDTPPMCRSRSRKLEDLPPLRAPAPAPPPR